MDEMDLLTRMRDNGPRRVSPRAEHRFRAAMYQTRFPERAGLAPRRKRFLMAGGLAAAASAAAALLLGLIVPAGGGANGANSLAAIQAVSFIKEHGYIKVVIKNLYADTSWYNADFARHHMNITLRLIPSSPSLVGSIEAMSTDGTPGSNEISLINKPGDCAGDGTTCTIGFKVPIDFHGQADMYICRPAHPGERYATTGSIFGKGEALAGLSS
jgi:hypothetical protein